MNKNWKRNTKILGLSMMALLTLVCPTRLQAQSLADCQEAAEHNYPLIRQYDLIAKTTDLTVSNIQKGWLPQVSASAQATYQSDVMSWPENIKRMFGQMGVEMKGLKKDQYRVGIDVQQTVYDGGSMSRQKAIARQQGEVQNLQNEVNLYQVRQRVNEMYFALLQLDEQLQLNADLQALLLSSERQLSSMVKSGTAATSDWENVQAERLQVDQQKITLQSQREMMQQMLSTFCGIAITHPQKPQVDNSYLDTSHSSLNARPELRLFEAQLKLADAQEKALNSLLRPKLGVFAQGYYGYPGYNMFEDMMSHDWSWNGMVGVKMSWNIGALYTRKNDKAKLQAQRDLTNNHREVFLFNNQLSQIQERAEINRFRKLMQTDEEIIALRSRVRKSAESKLAHGIIDVTSLLREIHSENSAKVQQSMHEIEMLKQIYELSYQLGVRR